MFGVEQCYYSEKEMHYYNHRYSRDHTEKEEHKITLIRLREKIIDKDNQEV